MSYPNSGSLLTPRINSGLSTQITVKVGGTTVGAIKQLSIKQSRDMNIYEEIGTSGIVEIVPKGAAKISLSIQRVVFDQLHITEAFARGFLNLQAQRMPFNIEIIDRSDTSSENSTLMHILSGCWFRDRTTPYDADNFIITESAEVVCERITSMRGSSPAALGGLRGIRYDYDDIERNTDAFGRPGRFDSSGFSEQTEETSSPPAPPPIQFARIFGA